MALSANAGTAIAIAITQAIARVRKTLAEFLHDVFFHSERNLYRVCFGADMFSICAPMLEP